MTTPQPKKHAKYSASSSERWLNCPGSISLIEKAPPQKDSAYATEGTKAHEAFEIALNNSKTTDELFAGFTEPMNHHAFMAAEWVRAEMGKAFCDDDDLLVEARSDLSYIEPDTFGTVDAAIVDVLKTLTIIDYKYGAGYAVDVKENTQMIFYALGIAHEYFYNFENVRLVIIQPRAEHPDGAIRTYTMTMAELRYWEGAFKHGIAESKKPDAPHNPGPWCRFCPAKIICPALSKNALATARLEFSDTPEIVSGPDFSLLNAADLSRALAAFDKLEDWIKAGREYAFDVLNSGGSVPGYKLVQKQGRRKWADPAAAQALAQLEHGDKVLDIELKSPAQLEKIISKAWVEEHSVMVSSGLTIAEDSDKRPATSNVLQDFGVVAESTEAAVVKKPAKTKTKKKEYVNE